MKKAIYFLLLLAFPLSAQDIGGAYYVVPSDSSYSGMNPSSDSNDGSYLNPFATPQAAFNVAEPLDTVYFRGGTWMPTTPNRASTTYYIDPYGEFGTASGNDGGGGDSTICFFNYPNESVIFDMGDLVCCIHIKSPNQC